MRLIITKKKNPNINIPKRIITSNDKSHIKSVSMLSKQLKIQPQYDNNMNNITKIMQNNKSDDILFCGSSSEIVEIVHNLIYKLYYKTMNLKWNKNPEATYDSLNDFSTIWIIDPTDHTLKVYNYFDVFYNKYYDYYDVNYSHVSILPFYTFILTDNNLSITGTLINNIKGFFYNLVT